MREKLRGRETQNFTLDHARKSPYHSKHTRPFPDKNTAVFGSELRPLRRKSLRFEFSKNKNEIPPPSSPSSQVNEICLELQLCNAKCLQTCDPHVYACGDSFRPLPRTCLLWEIYVPFRSLHITRSLPVSWNEIIDDDSMGQRHEIHIEVCSRWPEIGLDRSMIDNVPTGKGVLRERALCAEFE